MILLNLAGCFGQTFQGFLVNLPGLFGEPSGSFWQGPRAAARKTFRGVLVNLPGLFGKPSGLFWLTFRTVLVNLPGLFGSPSGVLSFNPARPFCRRSARLSPKGQEDKVHRYSRYLIRPFSGAAA